MTGMEAWSLVSPLLAAHSVHRKGEGINDLDEAYLLVFHALKEYDNGKVIHKGEITSCETCKFEDKAEDEYPCEKCNKRYVNYWRAKE